MQRRNISERVSSALAALSPGIVGQLLLFLDNWTLNNLVRNVETLSVEFCCEVACGWFPAQLVLDLQLGSLAFHPIQPLGSYLARFAR